MQWLSENYHLLYILIVVILLGLSWHFLNRSQFDERRRRRFSKKSIKRSALEYQKKFHNDEFEKFLRKSKLPKWVTSGRINALRLFILLGLILIAVLQFLTKEEYLTLSEMFIFGSIPLLLTPKKRYPFYYVVQQMKKMNANGISNEVYQLYNEIKAGFQIQNGVSNSYYTIQNALPYYKKIRPALEKMLPFLQKKELNEAWEIFSNELDIPEAKMLSVVMREVESVTPDQALLLLEQKRQEFSNHLFNRYTDYLRKRKGIIFILVTAGAMTVFINELTVFFMWYKEVMETVNQNME